MSSNIQAAISRSLVSSIAVKILSFFVSTLIVRNSSAADFGKLSINFQLVVSMSLFLLKEGVRKSALRCGSIENGRIMIWIGHLATCGFIIPSVIFGYMHLVDRESPLIQLSLAVSLWLESFAEIVLFEQAVGRGNLAVRNIAETWASLASSLAMLVAILFSLNGSTAFVISHNVFSIILLLIASYRVSLYEILRAAPFNKFIFSSTKTEIITPLTELALMSFQKLFLTEGERMITLAYLPPEGVGQLGLVNNAGSLVLRIFFAPIEDIAFTAFTKPDNDRETRLALLRSVLLVQVSIASLGIAFGIPLCEAVIYVLYGPEWARQLSVVRMLQFYCVLLMVFALNGSLEAYYLAVASSKQLRLSLVSQWVVFASLIIGVFIASPLGAVAILIGNGISMLVRIAWCFTVFDSVFDPFHSSFLRVLGTIFTAGVMFQLSLGGFSEFLRDATPLKKHTLVLALATFLALGTILIILPRIKGTLLELKKKQ